MWRGSPHFISGGLRGIRKIQEFFNFCNDFSMLPLENYVAPLRVIPAVTAWGRRKKEKIKC